MEANDYHLVQDPDFRHRVKKVHVRPETWIGVHKTQEGQAVCSRCDLNLYPYEMRVIKQRYVVGDRPTGNERWTIDQPRCPVCDPDLPTGVCEGDPI